MIKTNFIYPEISEQDRQFGAGLTAPILRPNGDWRDFLPENEDQNVRGIESSACYVEAQQACLATLLEEKFSIPNSNFSARFNALLSGGSEGGGDPVRGAKSVKYDGLVPEKLMSWEGIDDWREYHSFSGADEEECKVKGKEWVNQWQADFKILTEKELPLETKYILLKEGLQRSPVPISVSAWYEWDGMYFKPQGLRDNHLTLAVFVDDQNRIHVRDTYSPYSKILEPNTDFEFSMWWSIKKKEVKNWSVSLCSIIKNLWQ